MWIEALLASVSMDSIYCEKSLALSMTNFFIPNPFKR